VLIADCVINPRCTLRLLSVVRAVPRGAAVLLIACQPIIVFMMIRSLVESAAMQWRRPGDHYKP